ncbi:uncharacterized protein A4U43_C08F35000 [Asparagus officinalis]|nr:uncharacterized protein A4U43_C08F35000 [Asparagus officinalis]
MAALSPPQIYFLISSFPNPNNSIRTHKIPASSPKSKKEADFSSRTVHCSAANKSSSSAEKKRSSSFPAQNRSICRLNPVKVTTNLTRGQPNPREKRRRGDEGERERKVGSVGGKKGGGEVGGESGERGGGEGGGEEGESPVVAERRREVEREERRKELRVWR